MNVEFQDENQGGYGTPDVGGSSSKMVTWLIRKGWAKDERQANTTLLISSVVFFVLAIIVFFI